MRAGNVSFPPSIWGKITTGLQILMVFLVIVPALVENPLLHLARVGCTWLVAGFTIFSGLHYSLTIARRVGQ